MFHTPQGQRVTLIAKKHCLEREFISRTTRPKSEPWILLTEPLSSLILNNYMYILFLCMMGVHSCYGIWLARPLVGGPARGLANGILRPWCIPFIQYYIRKCFQDSSHDEYCTIDGLRFTISTIIWVMRWTTS